MKKYQIDIKDILIVILLLFGLYWFLLKPEGEHTTIKETTTVDIERIVETAVNAALKNQKPSQQPVIIYQDRIKEVGSIKDVPEEDLDKFTTLNKYRDTTEISNEKAKGKIYSEILSDGTVYSNKITTDFEVKTITNTIEKETIKYPSGLYLEPSVYANPNSFNFSTGLQIKYIYKANFGVGVGVQYNTIDKGVYYGLSVTKKIF